MHTLVHIWPDWQWLEGLAQAVPADRLDCSFTAAALAAALLPRMDAARLEGCTALHCAALSGEVTMVTLKDSSDGVHKTILFFKRVVFCCCAGVTC